MNAYLRLKDPNYCVKVLLFNEPIVTDSYWYMPAILYVLVIIWAVDRTIGRKYLYPLIPILLLLNLCIGKYSHLVFGRNFDLCYSRNFLLFGLPFLLLGDWIASHRDVWAGKKKVLRIVFCLGLGLSLVEYFWLGSLPEAGQGNMYIGTPFMTVALFLLALQIQMPVVKEGASLLGRAGVTVSHWLAAIGHKYGMVIYLTHEALRRGGDLFLKMAVPGYYDLYVPFSPVIIFLGSIVVGWLFYRVRDCLQNLRVKREYSS